MNIVEIIFIAVGLAMDAFAVAIACSIALKEVSGRQIFRIAFHFGLFQAMMPVLGWLAGSKAQSYIADWDHWVAFTLLFLIGGKAILDALGNEEQSEDRGEELSRETKSVNTIDEPEKLRGKSDPTRGLSLLVYSVATSIDALAVGVSLAAIQVDIWEPAVIIGFVTLLMSAGGIILGNKIGAHYGQKVEILGGAILIGIGLKILLFHTILA